MPAAASVMPVALIMATLAPGARAPGAAAPGLLVPGQIVAAGPDMELLTSGYKTMGGRTFIVWSPTETNASYPILIALHGALDAQVFPSGSLMLREVEKWLQNLTQSAWGAELQSRYHLVAPMAPSGSWNVVAEPSHADDVAYVGSALVGHLLGHANVAPTVQLIGQSNGAGLVHRILIENEDSRIVAGVALSSQLNSFQFHEGSFYIGGKANRYDTPKAVLTARALLQVNGALDDTVPARGGRSELLVPSLVPTADTTRRTLGFLPWDKSAQHYAQSYGSVFEPNGELREDDAAQRIVLLGGQVQAALLKNGTHALTQQFMAAGNSSNLVGEAPAGALWLNGQLASRLDGSFIRDFLLDHAAPTPPHEMMLRPDQQPTIIRSQVHSLETAEPPRPLEAESPPTPPSSQPVPRDAGTTDVEELIGIAILLVIGLLILGGVLYITMPLFEGCLSMFLTIQVDDRHISSPEVRCKLDDDSVVFMGGQPGSAPASAPDAAPSDAQAPCAAPQPQPLTPRARAG